MIRIRGLRTELPDVRLCHPVGLGLDQASALDTEVRRAGLCPHRELAKVGHVATDRADEVVLPALSLRDHALTAQLLDAALAQVEQSRDHADRLSVRRHDDRLA
jgi:hypothetical protein